ncbi:hypothetical protein T4D_10761 [Trichinella pseudospiralis]|uniref:Uncharacterized protein n=1 Tax=Trichinella pseudospiralis TaxID=6337 RepID=A0A0V1FGP5_TRIPS|nr:hypothetical protein T4D_10761 [Trichinella pseudospiralis]
MPVTTDRKINCCGARNLSINRKTVLYLLKFRCLFRFAYMVDWIRHAFMLQICVQCTLKD